MKNWFTNLVGSPTGQMEKNPEKQQQKGQEKAQQSAQPQTTSEPPQNERRVLKSSSVMAKAKAKFPGQESLTTWSKQSEADLKKVKSSGFTFCVGDNRPTMSRFGSEAANQATTSSSKLPDMAQPQNKKFTWTTEGKIPQDSIISNPPKKTSVFGTPALFSGGSEHPDERGERDEAPPDLEAFTARRNPFSLLFPTDVDDRSIEATDVEIEGFFLYEPCLDRYDILERTETVVAAAAELKTAITDFSKEHMRTGKSADSDLVVVQHTFDKNVEALIALVLPLPMLRQLCYRAPLVTDKLYHLVSQSKGQETLERVKKYYQAMRIASRYEDTRVRIELLRTQFTDDYCRLVMDPIMRDMGLEKASKITKSAMERTERVNQLQAEELERLKKAIGIHQNTYDQMKISRCEALDKIASDEMEMRNTEKKHRGQVRKLEDALREAKQGLADEAAKKELRNTISELHKLEKDRKQDAIRFESSIADLKREVIEKDIRIQNQHVTIETLKNEKQSLKTNLDIEAARVKDYDSLLYERDSLQSQLDDLQSRLDDEVTSRETKITNLESALKAKQAATSQPSNLTSTVDHTQALVNRLRNSLVATTVQVKVIDSTLDNVDREIALLMQQMTDEEAIETEVEETKQQSPTSVPSKSVSRSTQTVSSGPSALYQQRPDGIIRKKHQLNEEFPSLPPAAKPMLGNAQKPTIPNIQPPASFGNYAKTTKKVSDQKLKGIPKQDRSDHTIIKKLDKHDHQGGVLKGTGAEHTQHGRPVGSFKDLCRDAMKRHNAGAG